MDETEQRRTFNDWLGSHRRLLFKVVNAYAFNPHDRDDLFQEIITQVWKSVPSFRAEASVGTWLYRVALNASLAWTRREQKHRSRTQELDRVEPALLGAASERDPRLDWLHEEIARMDHVDRSLTLLLLDGLSYREMAETLGISENHVGVKINRLKARLIGKSKETSHHGT